MSEMLIEKSLGIGPPVFRMTKVMPGLNVLHIEGSGVRVLIKFDPDELDAFSVSCIRHAEEAREMARAAAAPTEPRLTLPAPAPSPMGSVEQMPLSSARPSGPKNGGGQS